MWSPEEETQREKIIEARSEQIRANTHDCINYRDNCDKIHPNTERIVVARPKAFRDQEFKPGKWRNWILSPKVCIGYVNQHTLQLEVFNLSEVFAQMNANAKINVVHNIIENCLDDDERSMLFSDLQQTGRNSR